MYLGDVEYDDKIFFLMIISLMDFDKFETYLKNPDLKHEFKYHDYHANSQCDDLITKCKLERSSFCFKKSAFSLSELNHRVKAFSSFGSTPHTNTILVDSIHAYCAVPVFTCRGTIRETASSSSQSKNIRTSN